MSGLNKSMPKNKLEILWRLLWVWPGIVLISLSPGNINSASAVEYCQRMVCGRFEPYTDVHGTTWAADQAYAAGSWGYVVAGNSVQFNLGGENTYDATLFKSERRIDPPLNVKYQFDVPGPGKYYVKLLFMENTYGLPQLGGGGIGSRVFDVWINHLKVLDRFDILTQTGGRANRAVIKPFEVTVPAEGPYNIVLESPKFNAIEISTTPTLTDTLDAYTKASPTDEEVFRINCGGTKSLDPDNTLWMADEAFSQCQRWGYANGTARIKAQDSWPNPAAYRLATWREGGSDFYYRLALPNGTYRLALIFAENEFSSRRQRVFDVRVNDVPVAVQLDVFAQAGAGQLYTIPYTVTVTQEQITIRFANITAGLAMLNALEVKAESVSDDAFLNFVERRATEYFLANAPPFQAVNPANGLIADSVNNFSSASTQFCSIASVGFGLAALVVAADRGWITSSEARQRVLTTVQYFRNATSYLNDEQSGLTHKEGFFFHFLNMSTGKRYNTSVELSSIDSSLLFAGMLAARKKFATSQIQSLTQDIVGRANWVWFAQNDPNNFVAMAWQPGSGFENYPCWSWYCEGMLLNVLGVSSATHALTCTPWYNTQRYWDTYANIKYITHGPNDPQALFTHIFPLCYMDVRNQQDDKLDYFLNTRRAVEVNKRFCEDHAAQYLTYAEGGWGLTAVDSPKTGFSYYAYRPRDSEHDGTVSPNIVGASVPFAPEISIPTLRRMYFRYKHFIWGRYGFANSYNLNAPRTYEDTPSGQGWVGCNITGIDAGALVLGLENYRTGRIWERFMQNSEIAAALSQIGFKNPVIDDFESDHSLNDAPQQRDAQWWTSNNQTHKLETAANINGNFSTCLKVAYNKTAGEEWAFISAGNLSQPANMSYFLNATQVSFHALGQAEVLTKFKDTSGRESAGAVHSINSPDRWCNVSWDCSQLNWQECDPRQMKDLLIFIQPGRQGNGTVYLDNVTLGPGTSPPPPVLTSTPTLTPTPTPTPSWVDNFDNDGSIQDQADVRDAYWYSGTSVFNFTVVSNWAGNSTPGLKVTYNKPAGEEWAFISMSQLDWPGNCTNYSNVHELSMHVYGTVKLLLKFEDIQNDSSTDSGVINIVSPSAWTNVTWNYAGLAWSNCDPQHIKNILIFVQPGETGSGQFYVDNVALGPGSSPLVSGSAVKGQVTISELDGNCLPPWHRTKTPTPTAKGTLTPTITATPTSTVTSTPTAQKPSATKTTTPTRTATITPQVAALPEKVLAYPNPAKGKAVFAWKARNVETVRIEIYSMSGERVAVLRENTPGSGHVVWNTRDIAPGIYLYRMILTIDGKDQIQESKKIAIVK